MKGFLSLTFLMALTWAMLPAQNFKVNLYPEGQIPNYKDVGEQEKWDTTNIVRISKVQVPDIAVFFPAGSNKTGESVIICPGGGYHILAYDWEGENIARFWNSRGVTAFVLKYRLPTSEAQVEPYKSPLMDAQRAMRLVRYHAEEWGLDPHKVGIMGFSAGGHLASSLSTHYDGGNPDATDPVERLSCRPDFSILMYPVISFVEEFQHSGSRKALVGDNEDLMKYFSSDLQVTEDTPPALLIHASDDRGVPPQNSLRYYEALLENGVSAEMHLFPRGGHGFSLGIGKGHVDQWPELAYQWVKSLE